MSKLNLLLLSIALVGCSGRLDIDRTDENGTASDLRRRRPPAVDMAMAPTPPDMAMEPTSPDLASNPPPSSVPTLASVNAAQSFASMNANAYVQMLGGSLPLSGVSEATGVVSTNATSVNGTASTIQGPYGSTYMRFGKVADPLDGSRTVFLLGANGNDVPTYTHKGRVEITFAGLQLAKSGTTYWAAVEMYVPSARWPGGSAGAGNGNLLQLHTSSQSAVDYGGPWGFGVASPGLAPNPAATLGHLYDLTPGGSTDTSVRAYPYISDNAGWNAPPVYNFGPFARDAWHKVVVRWKGDPTGTTGTMALWIDGTQMVNETGIRLGPNVESTAFDYPKSGFDDYRNGGGTGTFQLMRSFVVVEDAGYTFDQVVALLN